MFSNRLIRSLAVASDETHLRLSPSDWRRVLDANADFCEGAESWRGSSAWGAYLLDKTGLRRRDLSFSDSLELCCGNGFLFFSFRELFPFDRTAHFIDLSNHQVAGFRQRCAAANIETPDLLTGDIGQLPFANGSLDLVYGNSFLHHLPDVGQYLREACRILRPGGRFIAFHEPNSSAPFLENFPRSLVRDVDTGSLTDIWLIRPEVIRKLAEEAGFSRVTVSAGGILYSFLVNPFQIVLAKLGRPTQSDLFVRLRRWLEAIESWLIPKRLRLRQAPSVAVVAEK